MSTIVVGGGVAGLRIAKALNATLITDRKDFVFLPLLPDAIENSVGVRFPIRHEKTIFETVTKVDTENNVVHTKQSQYEYDTLVLATGAQPLTPVPGIKTYAHTFYSLQDAKTIKSKLPAKRIIIIGGGPTGVELAFELQKHGQVTLIHNQDVVLPTFSKHAQRYAKEQLENAGVRIRFNANVDRITAKHVSADEDHPYDLAIWTAGVKANLIKGPDAMKGYTVRDTLQLKDHENVFAVGDAAQSGSPLTAQAAIQEADHVIKSIKRQQRNRPLKPFRYKEKGLMVQLGDKAHISAGPIRITGKLAAYLRRLYYSWALRTYR